MKFITAVMMSALLVTGTGSALAAKKEGKGYGAGGLSEEKMSDTAGEHRKAWAGSKEKELKEEKEKKEKKMKKEKKQK
ncbi:MAG: hypothetical protein OQL28_14785 [Sedimenticola sp.]|nr:hypothetical protein [Sedimenticola sp.]